jgi:DHA3 family tetracycline resistance protein-like MFS transporter
VDAFATYLSIRAVSAFAHACAYTLYLVYQVQDVGLDPLRLVLVGTALEVVCFLAQVPTGVIADLYSRRLSVVTGYLLCGVGTLVSAVPTFTAALVGTALWGIGVTCVDGAEEAWIADEAGEERAGAAYLRGAQVGHAAGIVGIAAAVALSPLGLSVPMLVGGGATVLLALGLTVVMPERHFRPALRGHGAGASEVGTRTRAMRDQVAAGTRVVRRWPVLWYLFGAAFFLALSSEGLDRLGQPHLLVDFAFPSVGTPAMWFGAFGVVAGLGSMALTQAVRHRVSTQAPARVGRTLAAWQAVIVLAVLVFALARQFWLAAAAALLVALLRAASGPLLTTWLVAQTESATRATVLSMAAQVDAAGQIVGGPPIGLLGQRISIRAALVGVAALLAPAVVLLARAVRHAQPPPASIAWTRSRVGGKDGRVDRNRLVKLSKRMSKALRHDPARAGLTLDAGGWVPVTTLLATLGVDRADLDAVVAGNDKQRFAVEPGPDGVERIRASQGHSIPVDLGLTPATPPERLYHGTAAAVWESIRATGLHRGGRHHVHLSADRDTAHRVGARRGGAVIVIPIDAAAMVRDGHVFYRSANGVWLTDAVPPRYLAPEA